MLPVLRNPVLMVAIFAALLGTVAVFTFAKPQFHPPYENEMIDFSKREYFSPTEVRRAFAANDIRFRRSYEAFGVLVLTDAPPPQQASELQVSVAPPNGKGSWGPKLQAYDERFGNVLVTYGGRDADLLQRIDASVASLR